MPQEEPAQKSRRFGILTFPLAPHSTIEREWRWAEELGFDHAWLPDSFSNPTIADFEVWTLLAALGTRTTRLRMGTLVTTIVSRHPVLLAAKALTVDHVSAGRIEVGIGIGDVEKECDVFGLPRWSPGERIARLEEQLGLLDELLRGNEVTRAGKHYSTSGTQLTSPIQQPRPPLLVSAEGPRALRLAARYADTWSTLAGQWAYAGSGGGVSEEQALATTKAKGEELERQSVGFGRPANTIRRLVLAYRQPVVPLSSLDAFDHFVGSYTEVGIDDFVFYWPPVLNLKERQAVTPEHRAVVERIAAARLNSRAPGSL